MQFVATNCTRQSVAEDTGRSREKEYTDVNRTNVLVTGEVLNPAAKVNTSILLYSTCILHFDVVVENKTVPLERMMIGLAMMLAAAVVTICLLIALGVWTIIRLIFGWGQRHINWTEYPNLNGILFIIAILGGWLLLSFIVGVLQPNSPLNLWKLVLVGMEITAKVIIVLVLAALGGSLIYLITGRFISWLFEPRE